MLFGGCNWICGCLFRSTLVIMDRVLVDGSLVFELASWFCYVWFVSHCDWTLVVFQLSAGNEGHFAFTFFVGSYFSVKS